MKDLATLSPKELVKEAQKRGAKLMKLGDEQSAINHALNQVVFGLMVEHLGLTKATFDFDYEYDDMGGTYPSWHLNLEGQLPGREVWHGIVSCFYSEEISLDGDETDPTEAELDRFFGAVRATLGLEDGSGFDWMLAPPESTSNGEQIVFPPEQAS